MWDLDTAVHAAIKGEAVPLDIASVVQHPNRRRFSFLSLTYGLVPCLDIGTEHLRWMGGARFTVGALQQIMLKRSYRARVALLEVEAAAGLGGGGAAAPRAGAAPGAAGADGPPLRHIGQFQSPALPGGELALPEGWSWLDRAEIQLFAACNLPLLDMTFPVAPEASLGSGHLDLIYTSRVGRLRGLQILLAVEEGKHLGMVHARKVVALALEPQSKGGWVQPRRCGGMVNV